MNAVVALPLRGRGAGLQPHALEQHLCATVSALAATLELRDPYTARHGRRVADVALGIGRLLGLPGPQLRGLELAAIIHDLGKLSVPVEILSKPGPITAVEFELIKGHAAAGAEVLAGLEFPWPLRDIIWQHHERLDGSGYPRGLRGGQILPEARILAVADVVEAMASHRPYRIALGLERALAEVEAGRGARYDIDAVDACCTLFRTLGHRLPD